MIEGAGLRVIGFVPGRGEGAGIYNQGTAGPEMPRQFRTTSSGFSGTNGPNSNGIDAAGGGIFSSGGSVTLEGGTIVQNNEALGTSTFLELGAGGNAYGGGLYASGGTLKVTDATLDNNTAVGGPEVP